MTNPKEDLQLAEALAVMNSLIANDIFLTPSGALTGIRDIKVIDTTTNDLYDPPLLAFNAALINPPVQLKQAADNIIFVGSRIFT